MKNGDNLGPWGMATRGPSALSSHHGIAPLDASPGELTAKIIWAAGTPPKKLEIIILVKRIALSGFLWKKETILKSINLSSKWETR